MSRLRLCTPLTPRGEGRKPAGKLFRRGAPPGITQGVGPAATLAETTLCCAEDAMQSQFDITNIVPQNPPVPSEPNPGAADLLRQILDVQREQLAHMQATAAAHDTSGRWRALLNQRAGGFETGAGAASSTSRVG